MDDRKEIRQKLWDACDAKDTTAATALIADHQMTGEDMDPSCLAKLCAAGNIEFLKRLAAELKLTTEDVRRGRNKCLVAACSTDQLAIAKWLVEEFKLTREDITMGETEETPRKNFALVRAAMRGHLPIVQWVVNEYKITKPEIQSTLVLDCALVAKQTNIVRWLIETLNIDRNDLLQGVDRIVMIFDTKDLDFIKWMVEKCGILRADVLAQEALYCPSTRGYLEVVKWMVEKFEITLDDIRANNYMILSGILRGTPELIDWCAATFKWTTGTINAALAATIQRDAEEAQEMAKLYAMISAKNEETHSSTS